MKFSAVLVLLSSTVQIFGASSWRPSLRDFVHTSWNQHEGVPLSSIGTITQTTDGYLWITTKDEGLLRFDGVRFMPVASPCVPQTSVGKTRGDGLGGLWISCDQGLFHSHVSGKVEPIKPTPAGPRGFCFVDNRHRLWTWEDSITYIRPDGTESPKIPNTGRPQGKRYCQAAEDSEGNVWFPTDNGLLRIKNDRAERFGSGTMYAVAPSRSGGIYALQENAVVLVTTRTITTVAAFGSELTPSHGTALAVSKAGVWFATRNHGVALIHDGKIDLFGSREGLSQGSAEFLYVDREDSVWVATSLGLNRFREPMSYMMTREHGLPPGRPSFVFRDSRNGLWVGSERSTIRIDLNHGKTEEISSAFSCIGEDQSGRIWLGKRDQVGFLRDRQFVPVSGADGKHIAGIDSFRQDEEGNFWALTGNNGLYKTVANRPVFQFPTKESRRLLVSKRHGIWYRYDIYNIVHIKDGRQTRWDPSSGLAGGSIYSIAEIGDSIWVGSTKGISRWRAGKWTAWTAEHGLPGEGRIFDIESDRQGRLWIMSEGGILVSSSEQFERAPKQRTRLEYLQIGSLDRVLPHLGGTSYFPRVTRGLDGTFYFATVDSVAVIDPNRVQEKSLRPQILLENILVNRRQLSDSAHAHFVEPEDIQFEYTSLSLRNPENVRFRYRLQNHDKDWIEAGTQRRATYSALKPGSYRFQVIGSGSEGVWNREGASYAFEVAAPFYKTPWFLGALLAATASLAWAVHQYRLQLEADRIRVRLEAQNAERLRIAQNIHDTFLQGVQSSAWLVDSAIEKIEKQPSQSRQLLERALQMVSQSADQARGMLFSLRSDPASAEPLLDRLSGLAAREATLYSDPPKVMIESQGKLISLRPSFSDELFFVASEALKNALRHAKAQNIRITLNFHSTVFELIIEDDGIGIDPVFIAEGRDGHYGLRGMRERAERHSGSLKIESSEGKGTRISFSAKTDRAYEQ